MKLTQKKLHKLKRLKNQTSKRYKKKRKNSKFHKKNKNRSFRRKKYINMRNKTIKKKYKMRGGALRKSDKKKATLAIGGLYGASVAGTFAYDSFINTAGGSWNDSYFDEIGTSINNLMDGTTDLTGPFAKIGPKIGQGFDSYFDLYSTDFVDGLGMEGFEATADVLGIGGLVGLTVLTGSALIGGWYYMQELREQSKKRKLNVNISTVDSFEREKAELLNENERLTDTIGSLIPEKEVKVEVSIGKQKEKLDKKINENEKKIAELDKKIDKFMNAIPKDLKMVMDTYEETMNVIYGISKEEIDLGNNKKIGVYSIIKKATETEASKTEAKIFILDRIVYNKVYINEQGDMEYINFDSPTIKDEDIKNYLIDNEINFDNTDYDESMKTLYTAKLNEKFKEEEDEYIKVGFKVYNKMQKFKRKYKEFKSVSLFKKLSNILPKNIQKKLEDINTNKKINRNVGMAKMYHANAEFYYEDAINKIKFGDFGYTDTSSIKDASSKDADIKAKNNKKLAELNKDLLKKLNELKNLPDKKKKEKRKIREDIIKLRKEISSIQGDDDNNANKALKNMYDNLNKLRDDARISEKSVVNEENEKKKKELVEKIKQEKEKNKPNMNELEKMTLELASIIKDSDGIDSVLSEINNEAINKEALNNNQEYKDQKRTLLIQLEGLKNLDGGGPGGISGENKNDKIYKFIKMIENDEYHLIKENERDILNLLKKEEEKEGNEDIFNQYFKTMDNIVNENQVDDRKQILIKGKNNDDIKKLTESLIKSNKTDNDIKEIKENIKNLKELDKNAAEKFEVLLKRINEVGGKETSKDKSKEPSTGDSEEKSKIEKSKIENELEMVKLKHKNEIELIKKDSSLEEKKRELEEATKKLKEIEEKAKQDLDEANKLNAEKMKQEAKQAEEEAQQRLKEAEKEAEKRLKEAEEEYAERLKEAEEEAAKERETAVSNAVSKAVGEEKERVKKEEEERLKSVENKKKEMIDSFMKDFVTNENIIMEHIKKITELNEGIDASNKNTTETQIKNEIEKILKIKPDLTKEDIDKLVELEKEEKKSLSVSRKINEIMIGKKIEKGDEEKTEEIDNKVERLRELTGKALAGDFNDSEIEERNEEMATLLKELKDSDEKFKNPEYQYDYENDDNKFFKKDMSLTREEERVESIIKEMESNENVDFVNRTNNEKEVMEKIKHKIYKTTTLNKSKDELFNFYYKLDKEMKDIENYIIDKMNIKIKPSETGEDKEKNKQQGGFFNKKRKKILKKLNEKLDGIDREYNKLFTILDNIFRNPHDSIEVQKNKNEIEKIKKTISLFVGNIGAIHIEYSKYLDEKAPDFLKYFANIEKLNKSILNMMDDFIDTIIKTKSKKKKDKYTTKDYVENIESLKTNLKKSSVNEEIIELLETDKELFLSNVNNSEYVNEDKEPEYDDYYKNFVNKILKRNGNKEYKKLLREREKIRLFFMEHVFDKRSIINELERFKKSIKINEEQMDILRKVNLDSLNLAEQEVLSNRSRFQKLFSSSKGIKNEFKESREEINNNYSEMYRTLLIDNYYRLLKSKFLSIFEDDSIFKEQKNIIDTQYKKHNLTKPSTVQVTNAKNDYIEFLGNELLKIRQFAPGDIYKREEVVKEVELEANDNDTAKVAEYEKKQGIKRDMNYLKQQSDELKERKENIEKEYLENEGNINNTKKVLDALTKDRINIVGKIEQKQEKIREYMENMRANEKIIKDEEAKLENATEEEKNEIQARIDRIKNTNISLSESIDKVRVEIDQDNIALEETSKKIELNTQKIQDYQQIRTNLTKEKEEADKSLKEVENNIKKENHKFGIPIPKFSNTKRARSSIREKMKNIREGKVLSDEDKELRYRQRQLLNEKFKNDPFINMGSMLYNLSSDKDPRIYGILSVKEDMNRWLNMMGPVTKDKVAAVNDIKTKKDDDDKKSEVITTTPVAPVVAPAVASTVTPTVTETEKEDEKTDNTEVTEEAVDNKEEKTDKEKTDKEKTDKTETVTVTEVTETETGTVTEADKTDETEANKTVTEETEETKETKETETGTETEADKTEETEADKTEEDKAKVTEEDKAKVTEGAKEVVETNEKEAATDKEAKTKEAKAKTDETGTDETGTEVTVDK